ncbi:MAG: hypothetical protein Q4615_04285 [Paracoccus aminovorans]|nr:hypothetical protein [Paracoccus aminovorans]
MASSQQIISDLRAHARALDGCHLSGTMMHSVCRSLRRGADEIDRLLGELAWLRAWAEIPEEPKAPKPHDPIPASLVQRYRDYVGQWPEERS